MNRRLAIAKHWLFNKTNAVSLIELLSKVLEPTCKYKAKPFISEMVFEDSFIKLKLKGFKDYLFYPKEININSLYQVITESTDEMQWHYYEIPETKVNPSDVVVDCGAAEGMFSFLVARRCSKVYAIEPLPIFVNSLKLTFSKINNVEIIPCALSDKCGSAFMNDQDISSTISKEGDIPIQIKTIDSLFFDKGIKINYLKADLEGYEMDMLNGAFNTIKQSKPVIAITTYHKAEHASEIKKYLLNIHPTYKIKFKGIEERVGAPVMLHAW